MILLTLLYRWFLGWFDGWFWEQVGALLDRTDLR